MYPGISVTFSILNHQEKQVIKLQSTLYTDQNHSNNNSFHECLALYSLHAIIILGQAFSIPKFNTQADLK